MSLKRFTRKKKIKMKNKINKLKMNLKLAFIKQIHSKIKISLTKCKRASIKKMYQLMDIVKYGEVIIMRYWVGVMDVVGLLINLVSAKAKKGKNQL